MIPSKNKLIISVLGCELIGIIGGISTFAAIPNWYAYLNKPAFAPPNWVFGPAWTILYFLMGTAFYLIWKQNFQKTGVKAAALIFLIQLLFNFLWSPVFFGLRSPLLALVDILILWLLILITIIRFLPLSKTAAFLLVPYLLWVSFATALNIAIVILN